MLELEIEAVRLVLSSLRTRYNAFAHINRLPSEILAHMFHFLRDIYKPIPKDRIGDLSLPSQVIGWVQVTHVCRQWRAVALEYPTLWSDITFTLGARWKEEFFHRSGTTPIVIELSMPVNYRFQKKNLGNFPVDLAHHMSHTRELSFTGIITDFMPAISLLCRPAPSLEKLFLHNLSTVSSHDYMPFVPLDFLGGYAPRLRDLNLHRWRMSWPSIAFQSLINLSITHNCHENVRNTSELGHLLDSLQKMPSLQKLTLKYVLSPLPANVTPHSLYGPTVTIPKLRSLRLADKTPECGLLLKHMAIPVTTECDISCIWTDRGCEFLLPWLSTRVDMSMPIRTISIKQRFKDLHIIASDQSDTNTDKRSSDNAKDVQPAPTIPGRLHFGR
ncbi:hypothetical protein EVG20_g9665 [Dentipellis fragilis]|uniref:F-box domain-containing protein n=1 Tax=Dentipellis fragilis TaxID=205917 RepID=A0A4Y9XWM5_9AGAM|nr:hypothetical protein EVG20_g9665 [Dentipellis fragilis]